MNHSSLLLLLLPLLLVPSLCPPVCAEDAKELAKVVPDLKNTEIQESVVSALREFDKEMAALDVKFREISPTWVADVQGAKDTFDLHLEFAYMEVSELSSDEEKARISKLIGNWRKVLFQFTDDKILAAGTVATGLSVQLHEDWVDLVDHLASGVYVTDGYKEWGFKLQEQFRERSIEVTKMKAMDSELKRFAERRRLKEIIGKLETRLGNLGHAAADRAVDAKAFLKRTNPEERQATYDELLDKTWEPGDLRSYAMWVPAGWFTMIDGWVEVMRERGGECVEAYAKAYASSVPLMKGELFSGVRLVADLGYEEFAKPVKALKETLD